MSLDSPASILFDSAGNAVEIIDFAGKHYMGNSMLQNVTISVVNTSTDPIDPGDEFVGDAEETFGVAGLQICVNSNQPIRVSVQQSNDSSNWDFRDEYDLPPSQGDGRTTQAVSKYFRVVVKNLGPVATTYFNLMSILCPVVEAVPRSLTPRGRLALSSQTTSFVPDPANFLTFGTGRALLLDTSRNLVTRSTVFTDELSFRDDFTCGATTVVLTGTSYFRTGETHVTGSGTSYESQVLKGQYVKLSTDDDDKFGIVSDVYSDTDLVLEEGYDGSTAGGVGVLSLWQYLTGAGASLVEVASELIFTSGMTPFSASMAAHAGDYLPFVLRVRAKFSQRIANQAAMTGFMDDPAPLSANAQAYVMFDGTDNTKVTLVSGSDKTSLEQTTVALHAGGVTEDYHDYLIQVTNEGVTLLVDDVRLASHTRHIPEPYQVMDVYAGTFNYGAPASSSDFTLDVVALSNYDKIDVGITPQGESLLVRELPSPTSDSDSVAGADVDTEILPANLERLGATVYNDSAAILYLKLGTAASLTSFTVRMRPYAYYEVPYSYVGAIHGIWATSTGNARWTELT